MAGIYIHIPFCKQACHYCDFHFTISLRHKASLLAAIEKEIFMQRSFLKGAGIDSIYFGGGTPSLLSAEEINTIIKAIASNYKVNHNPEITLEANPDDITIDHLKDLKETGINRLSIGIQTFDDQMLQFMNRAHRSKDALASFDHARKAGFGNINFDLIYGLPAKDHQSLDYDLDQLASMSPEHISAYCLTIEDKTIFGKWLKMGKLKEVDEYFAAKQFTMVHNKLSSLGYNHYEVSNYAKDGFESRHNSNYWKEEQYLGIGPSAHSYNGDTRQFNIYNNLKYITSIANDEIPSTIEKLTKSEKMNDYILTSIRTSWGCDLEKLEKEFNYKLDDRRSEFIKSITGKELAILKNNVLILTPKGMLLADSIASELFD